MRARSIVTLLQEVTEITKQSQMMAPAVKQ
jgi:hypothetical protein